MFFSASRNSWRLYCRRLNGFADSRDWLLRLSKIRFYSVTHHTTCNTHLPSRARAWNMAGDMCHLRPWCCLILSSGVAKELCTVARWHWSVTSERAGAACSMLFWIWKTQHGCLMLFFFFFQKSDGMVWLTLNPVLVLRCELTKNMPWQYTAVILIKVALEMINV